VLRVTLKAGSKSGWRTGATQQAKAPGYLPFEPSAAHLFLQLVSRRYEKGAMLLASNRSVGEWGTVRNARSPRAS
jgi:hypothetical protein